MIMYRVCRPKVEALGSQSQIKRFFEGQELGSGGSPRSAKCDRPCSHGMLFRSTTHYGKRCLDRLVCSHCRTPPQLELELCLLVDNAHPGFKKAMN